MVFRSVVYGLETYSPHDNDTGITNDVLLSVPNYSTNIAAAWKVVSEMKRRGWEIRMEGVPVGQMVKFYNYKHPLLDGRPYVSDAVEVAISRAALLAVMESK
jgi:hypothetical protein